MSGSDLCESYAADVLVMEKWCWCSALMDEIAASEGLDVPKIHCRRNGCSIIEARRSLARAGIDAAALGLSIETET